MATTVWYPPMRIDLDAGEGGGVYIFYTAEHFLGSGDEYYINSRLGDSDYRLSARIISLLLSLRRIRRVAVIIRGNETAKSAIWLSSHRTANPAARGPFWRTTLAHAKDSLCSENPFCAESITLRTHWIMVVIDPYTRRIVGFVVHIGDVDGPTVWRIFNELTSGEGGPQRGGIYKRLWDYQSGGFLAPD